MKVLVSACLLGRNCKYNGGNNRDENVIAFLRDKEVVAVCPEAMAGLGIPRTPMEIVNGKLMNKDGVEVDQAVRAAIDAIVARLKKEPVELAILKSRSPTCGVKQVYDGTFTGTLINGAGVLTRALRELGISTLDAEDLPTAL